MFHHYCQVIHVTDHLIVDFHALEVVCCYISFLEHQLLQPPIHHFSTPIWPTQQSSQWKVTLLQRQFTWQEKKTCVCFFPFYVTCDMMVQWFHQQGCSPRKIVGKSLLLNSGIQSNLTKEPCLSATLFEARFS